MPVDDPFEPALPASRATDEPARPAASSNHTVQSPRVILRNWVIFALGCAVLYFLGVWLSR